MNDFNKLNLPLSFLQNLDSLGYKTMTQIQELSLPHVLNGADIIAQAKTGSGKTAAFGIGLLLKINLKNISPQALVICPTRELAAQVAASLRKLARCMPNIKILELCGGMPMRAQMFSLEAGAHILVGTPGRIDDHYSKNTIDFKTINTFVLDEADKMLDMGFFEDISKIASLLPSTRQTMLFSATFPPKIEILAKEILKNPVFVKGEVLHDNSKIEHYFFINRKLEIAQAVNKLLSKFSPKSAIVFCSTKIFAKELANELELLGHSVECLNGDLEQIERNEVLIKFANKSAAILVATDVASRGLDIAGVDLVLNVGLPHDNEVYIHRVGRSARGEGTNGIAASIVSAENVVKLDEIAKMCSLSSIDIQDVSELVNIKNIQIKSDFFTIIINGGKKSKIRAGDILGALIKEQGIDGKLIGKIDILDNYSFVALDKILYKQIRDLRNGIKIKSKLWKIIQN